VTPIFTAGPYRAVELHPHDIPRLQRFFEENPEYHRTVSGVPPRVNEADEEFHAVLPPQFRFTRKWVLAFTQGSRRG
jgi:hypothetical protein